MLLGLTTVTGLTGENALKGYISMVLGLMLSMVGFDIISGDAALHLRHHRDAGRHRLPAGGHRPLRHGRGAGRRRGGRRHAASSRRATGCATCCRAAADWARSRWAIVARHGARLLRRRAARAPGPTIASFLAYTLEKKVSKHPEEFGKGAIEGVAGPESANNAAVGRRHGADAHARHPGLGHHRDHAGRPHDVGAAAGAAAVREEPGLRLGADRLAVHRQRHAADPQHRVHPAVRAGAAHPLQHPDAADHRLLHHRAPTR